MDVAYNQYSHMGRRQNRSTTNLNHLTLAPLTSKLALTEGDHDFTTEPPSYLQGKSAPTTPRLLSRSPGRSPHQSRTRGTSVPSSANRLPKSKSATHLPPSHNNKRHSQHRPISPTTKRRSHDPFFTHPTTPHHRDRSTDSDWLLRAGALISTETRESKGQAWLISRASSTSLAGLRDPDEDAFDRELALERELLLATSRAGSRRHSVGPDDEDHVSSPPYSRYGSRSHSRATSRAGSRSQMMTPLERREVDGYFPPTAAADDDTVSIAGPDFVNLDEELEVDGEFDTSLEDEAYVRRLVKKGNGGVGSWFGSVLGVQLFSVEENSEESDADDEDEDEASEGELEEGGADQLRRSMSSKRLEAITISAAGEEQMPPPKEDEGGWHDAAWLLTVASKVLL